MCARALFSSVNTAVQRKERSKERLLRLCVCVDEAHTQTNQPTNTDRQHTAVHSLKGIEDSLVLNVERVEECEDSLATTAADETQQHTTQ